MDKGLAWESAPDDADCERLADEFAVELLTGNAHTVYESDLRLTREQLAEAARATSAEDRVDPGVAALNYAWGKDFQPVGIGALKILKPDADAPQTVRAVCAARMHWENLI